MKTGSYASEQMNTAVRNNLSEGRYRRVSVKGLGCALLGLGGVIPFVSYSWFLLAIEIWKKAGMDINEIAADQARYKERRRLLEQERRTEFDGNPQAKWYQFGISTACPLPMPEHPTMRKIYAGAVIAGTAALLCWNAARLPSVPAANPEPAALIKR